MNWFKWFNSFILSIILVVLAWSGYDTSKQLYSINTSIIASSFFVVRHMEDSIERNHQY